jgi:hypothetical protein
MGTAVSEVPAEAAATARVKVSSPEQPGMASAARPADRLPAGGVNLEEHFTDEQLRLWNITKLLQRLSSAAAADPSAVLPHSPAAGSGARAASHLVRRSLSGSADPESDGAVAANSRREVCECAVSVEFLLEFAREVRAAWGDSSRPPLLGAACRHPHCAIPQATARVRGY